MADDTVVLRRVRVPSLPATIAVLAAVASMAGSFALGGTTTEFTVSTGSVTAKAAVADTRSAPDRFPIGGPSVQTALDVAKAHWGATPCNGQFTVAWELLDRNTNATASWRNPTDAWNNAGANYDCEIRFNTIAQYDWEKFCSVMAHEVGHLVGRPHVNDPRDLMSPMYSEPLPVCVATPDPAAAPVVAPQPQTTARPQRRSTRSSRTSSAKRKAATRKTAAKRRATALRIKKARRARQARARRALARRSKARAARVQTGDRRFSSHSRA